MALFTHRVFFLCLDYIAAPGSQEDDIHNVQSVIDSLSLDYLQISLSHITGTINISYSENNQNNKHM